MERTWESIEEGRIFGRGHPAGDFLEAYLWDVIELGEGVLKVGAHLPDHVRNPRGQLFGGFTPTYVDLLSLVTLRRARHEPRLGPRLWFATTSMHIDYFEPILGPRFEMHSVLEKKRGRTNVVSTRFFQDGELAVLAQTTMREVAVDRTLGDA